jgi:EpsI family protein
MNRHRPIAWLAGGAMLACALLSHFWRPQPVAAPPQRLEAMIPASFGEWRIDPSIIPVAPTPDVQSNLDRLYSQIVARTYVNSAGERVMLVVAYGGDQSDSLKAHRQEVCYQAQGFAIREVRRENVALAAGELPLVRVHAQNGSRSEPFSYWFTMGDRVVIGRGERLVAQIGHGLRGEVPDGLLVRVSSLSKEPGTAYEAQDGFVRALLAAVPESTRRRLAG